MLMPEQPTRVITENEIVQARVKKTNSKIDVLGKCRLT
jgi:hypothetical protein